MSQWISPDQIRARFAGAMSAMYRREVPQYGALIELVEEVNRDTLAADEALAAGLASAGGLHRLAVERHGAIRVGTPDELAMLRRLFAVMGMYPVGYYDLAPAGVPVHSTAFRPVADDALQKNPFRVFTSLLRPELIASDALRQQALALLDARDIFTPGVKTLIERCEVRGGLDDADADAFVAEALETFRWHSDATVDKPTYDALSAEHPLIADVVCFRGPHINHLTPRTLDIDEVQRRMPERGITPKALIEGPPPRRCPLLLRQTSFKALNEPVRFGAAAGSHTARFGEIEQRGAALTAKGRALYDRLLAEVKAQPQTSDNATHQARLTKAFAAFPDDEAALRRQGLAFFHYRVADADRRSRQRPAEAPGEAHIEALIADGALAATPMVYEDFLPVSAAGIFQSNLSADSPSVDESARRPGNHTRDSQTAFEAALGREVIDEIALYAQRERASLEAALEALKAR
ncbi:VOC family protein [Halomonas cibimaris]|uniref:2-oxoadipate dioxygenase/decarboxylase n=1 Tax=Halomonas cibimaris TaxID=657012 RepID=A0ABP7LBT0_9GAMM